MNYDEKIAGQQALVDRLKDDYKKNPSDGLRLELNRKSDTLLHLKNMAKENPKDRAEQAAKKARSSALGGAVVQPFV